ncbi:MAG TPA: hypothetical protein VFM10_00550 [Terriglobales bacterium]|jgi:cytochrome bd-type quinol oxidase subunit 1|nr:hypothetical protein [Terriglobales bacterium]
MSGKRLIKRIATVMLMTLGFFVLLAVMRAEATPIRPDVRRVLAQPQSSPAQFAPARAGWDGPEMPKSPQMVNTTYEKLSPATNARMVRQSLIAAFLPDYRALAAIALVILLLRRIRKTRQQALATAPAPAPALATPPESSGEKSKLEHVA